MTLPRSRLQWLAALVLVAMLCAALYTMSAITLAVFGVARSPSWVFWLSERGHWTGAAVTLAIGLYLMFVRAVRD